MIEANIYDAANNRRRTTVGYYTFTLPDGASCSLPNHVNEYAAAATTVLRQRIAGQDAAHAHLQLTTEVLNQKYNSEGRLQFELRFTFANLGENSILLDKRSSVIPQYMISKTLKAASERKYELNSSRLIGLGSGVMSFDTALDESLFIALKPGESYLLNGSLTLPLLDDKSSKRPALHRGPHVLQVVVLTWYYPKVSNIRSRAQWAKKGYLWSDAVTSRPMEFLLKEVPTP